MLPGRLHTSQNDPLVHLRHHYSEVMHHYGGWWNVNVNGISPLTSLWEEAHVNEDGWGKERGTKNSGQLYKLKNEVD